MNLLNQPTVAEVLTQLSRILAFKTFKNSSILSTFLDYIVRTKLAGNAIQLKEYTIGVAVLLKKADYNPQTDAAVRIHASRLRKALDEYYSIETHAVELFISIPKGSYIPYFEWRINSDKGFVNQTEFEGVKPSIALLPFHAYDETLLPLADGICDQICTELTNYNELLVKAYFNSRHVATQVSDIKSAGYLLDCNYLITGTIQTDGMFLRCRVQLIRTHDQQQLWASAYEKKMAEFNTFEIQDDIVLHVVNNIAGSYGIINRTKAQKILKHDGGILNIKVYDAIFWYYHMVSNQNEVVFEKAIAAMKNAVQIDSNYAMGWAVLSETYVSGVFNGFNSQIENPLQEAIACGKRALRCDPSCQAAYQALALAYLFQHKKKECLDIIEQWQMLKSNAAGIAGGIGFCLICCGKYDAGFKLMQHSIQINPYYPWWFNGGLAFYHYKQKNWSEVVFCSDKLNIYSDSWKLILYIAASFEMGDNIKATAFKLQFSNEFPFILQHLDPYIGAFIQDKKLSNRLIKVIKLVE